MGQPVVNLPLMLKKQADVDGALKRLRALPASGGFLSVCVCVSTPHPWEWIMCQSGLQVAAGQPLYTEVEERQAGFKYLRGSDGAELSKGCTERTLQKPPYRTPLSSGSLFSLLSLRHSPCHLSILTPTPISHVSDHLFFFPHFSFIWTCGKK